MPNLVICLTILRFALFGSRDPATNNQWGGNINNNLRSLLLLGLLFNGWKKLCRCKNIMKKTCKWKWFIFHFRLWSCCWKWQQASNLPLRCVIFFFVKDCFYFVYQLFIFVIYIYFVNLLYNKSYIQISIVHLCYINLFYNKIFFWPIFSVYFSIF